MLQAHLCIARTQSQWTGRGCAHSTHRARSQKDPKSLPTRLWMLHPSSTFIILAFHGFIKWERVSFQIFLMMIGFTKRLTRQLQLKISLIMTELLLSLSPWPSFGFDPHFRPKKKSQNCKINEVNLHTNFHNKIILFRILKLLCSSCFPDVLYINMNVDADVQEDIYAVFV